MGVICKYSSQSYFNSNSSIKRDQEKISQLGIQIFQKFYFDGKSSISKSESIHLRDISRHYGHLVNEKLNVLGIDVNNKIKFQFYSSMVGRKGNLKPLLELLKNNFGLPNSKFFTAELSQGNTQRWVISWIVDDFFLRSFINNN
ncbi:hypothetical protein DICPUDRAFT_74204 [Dictyostelium purpureum]|uniref:Uncharacterized protein n=1 Tax=Dictyostelium purpureum TaxID=5786 RepID=F0Z732_DICPU|nr:uncharacterized protein DICPUDRAFT_74204 [Dictyostelium purpureum]EGC40304.1 hypothetical protein DICPUDRAFT_74204 [Dictyostelium purpureum]|eukprot:XP_003283240.1 hypothetical protein DICPUDRAFT_74204 [Dictyostelium purpureum]